jgi:hypothetical protein
MHQEEHPAEEHPAEEHPAEEHPAEEHPVEEEEPRLLAALQQADRMN